MTGFISFVNKISSMYVIYLLFFFFLSIQNVYSDTETCIYCHASEVALKVLVKKPDGKSVTHAKIDITPENYYRLFLVDKELIKRDIHFKNGCTPCHRGDPTSIEEEKAHYGIVKRPSSDLKVCSECHGDIVKHFKESLHYTAKGLLEKVSKRLSNNEKKIFEEKIYTLSCKKCHASCGDCHVSYPKTQNNLSGLMDRHRFIKIDEEKTCGKCHYHTIYLEWTKKVAQKSNIHYQKGLKCIDCHKKQHIHGDGNTYKFKEEVKGRPKCKDCHKLKEKTKSKAALAHTKHEGKVSCYGCHAAGKYNNCFDCHLDNGSKIKEGFYLGVSPKDKKTLTTLRAIPMHREIFVQHGIKIERFDEEPDFKEAYVHNIQKITERTRSCDICHMAKKGFLNEKDLKDNGSMANKSLIYKMGQMDIR